MKVLHVPFGEFVNASERKALGHLKSRLQSIAGNDLWYLLTNLNFSSSHREQSAEIDMVVIGPPGVRVIEVKHWNSSWIDRNADSVEREADRVTDKAKKLGTRLRKRVPKAGYVDGTFLVTARAPRVVGLSGRRVRGIPFCTLREWKVAIGFEERRRLSSGRTRKVANAIARHVAAVVDGSVRHLRGYENLELQTPKDQRFHRVYKGVRAGTQDRVDVHLYDLSVDERDAETRARRESEALFQLYRHEWAPAVRDSFQPLADYPGEMFFFAVVDPYAPSIGRLRSDESWGTDARLQYARACVRALTELHTPSTKGERMLHRNLTPDTVLVDGGNKPILTGFEFARIPSAVTVASVPVNAGAWDGAVSPEVRTSGLGAADYRSDVFSLCASLAEVFKRRDDERSRRALDATARGVATDPEERISLEELDARFSRILGDPIPADPPPPADEWTAGQVVSFRGNDYRILERLGSGGIGTAFRVVGINRSTGEESGTYVGKIVRDRKAGRRTIASYALVRPHLGRHRAASAVFEVASEWQENDFVALMTWVEGSALGEIAGGFPPVSKHGQAESAEALALRWLGTMCGALDLLHSNGLVHGDVSPGNMIVSEGDLVLTDYDLVAKVGESIPSPGTLKYCSPSRQRNEPATAADDVFALAASFFGTVFGRPPFASSSPSDKELGLHWDGVDRKKFPSLASFLDKATHPSKTQRYGNGGEALVALQRRSDLIGRQDLPVSASDSAPLPRQPDDDFDPDFFAPRWVPVMERLSAAEGVSLVPGDDVVEHGKVIDHYLAQVTVGDTTVHLVDQQVDRAGDVAKALQGQGLKVVVVRPSQTAREIVRELSADRGRGQPGAHTPTLGNQVQQEPPAAPDGVDFVGGRNRLVEWLRRQLIGPAQETGDTLVGISPLDRYPTGVLYPVESGFSGLDPASPQEVDAPSDADLEDPDEEILERGEGKESTLAQPARRRRYVPPSSVGFSFFVLGRARFRITVQAATYKVRERAELGRYARREYERTPLAETTLAWRAGEVFEQPPDAPFGVDVRGRRFQGGKIFTISLYNRQQMPLSAHPGQRARLLVEKSLFEAQLECLVESGQLAEYPRVDKSLLSDEEQEIELQYRHKSIIAVGHGGAVNWRVGCQRPAKVRTEFLPAVEVRRVTMDLAGQGERALGIAFLATASFDEVLSALGRFVDGYGAWVASQTIKEFDPSERPPAERLLARMVNALERMKRGVALLKHDRVVARSFQIANQAMLDQMQQSDRVRGKDPAEAVYRWRPFQLAFLLAVVESTVTEDNDFRDVVDLIWFPTGGGKTEAYLGLIALLIAWRRLKHGPSGAGTAAFMRYTLRLLTKQQFERAARIIFALDLLRRGRIKELGSDPITVGIWVGKATSPNRFMQAHDYAEEIQAGATAPNGLVLAECPWCGSEFDAGNYRASKTNFEFACLSERCEFSNGAAPLPCNVVDEALYQDPPSLLIGTIDKFARLAWMGRAHGFFGGNSQRPPELIIQDELHLITGPLGSVAGLYEAGLDTLLRARGLRPKYVASTATIRMAREQVRRLYGRDVSVFPPPGLTCEDCYFARTDMQGPGRLYVGYLAPMIDKRHCLAPMAAALLAAPLELFADDDDRAALLDAWWTQVVYHTSLVSVGSSHNNYMVDVRAWTRWIGAESESGEGMNSESQEGAEPSGEPRRPFVERARNLRIDQLTSIKSAKENAATFAKLAKRRDEEGHLDVVLATNMVSVGLDVSRLAVMIVNGQPFTTAEYIQATSRVGRADVPGFVCANYYRHHASSLFHYENFRPYHESFYRFVEPTSVTPYTYQVRSRALHAALVIALRHSCESLRENKSAGDFDRCDERTQEVIELLKKRCAEAERAGEDGQTAAHIDRLARQWHDEVQRSRTSRRSLKYESHRDRAYDALLRDYNDRGPGLWPTLNSMRDVERTAVLKET